MTFRPLTLLMALLMLIFLSGCGTDTKTVTELGGSGFTANHFDSIATPGSNEDRTVTVATTCSPSRCTCTAAPSGAMAHAPAVPSSPRAASRAASLAASTHRICIETAVRADTHTSSTATRLATPRAASIVALPDSSPRRWCSARDR